MSAKSGLPLKVIKHWFRNTLFKERQRNKDSPYNFANPPQLGIDLEMYEKTGEAKIISVNPDDTNYLPKSDSKPSPDEHKSIVKAEEQEAAGDSSAEENQSSPKAKEEPKSPATASTVAPIASPPLNPAMQMMAMLKASEALRQISGGSGASSSNASANPLGLLMAAQMAQQQPATIPQSFPFGAQSNETTTTMASRPPPSVSSSATSTMPPMTGTSRRANRTRFTDYQLKTLQEFFEKQAYPKDDDLEFLSKKLQLSPRVIVVWFQNARQKARKIYENQPNAESNDRFVKTPGSNYQCRRCSLVFQRSVV